MVNIGEINASGRNVGSITIPGDLGRIVVGDDTGIALKSLKVRSLYAEGATTGATSWASSFGGTVGSLQVATDVFGAITVFTGELVSVVIGGSLIGTVTDSGMIHALVKIGAVTVKGNIVGGSGSISGIIFSNGGVGKVVVGGRRLCQMYPDRWWLW